MAGGFHKLLYGLALVAAFVRVITGIVVAVIIAKARHLIIWDQDGTITSKQTIICAERRGVSDVVQRNSQEGATLVRWANPH